MVFDIYDIYITVFCKILIKFVSSAGSMFLIVCWLNMTCDDVIIYP